MCCSDLGNGEQFSADIDPAEVDMIRKFVERKGLGRRNMTEEKPYKAHLLQGWSGTLTA